MRFNNYALNNIYDKTDGCCHICHKKLAFANYGVHRAKGAWHVDHSIPRAKGGSNRLGNLFAACIPCNLEKSTRSTKEVRYSKGKLRAPHSKERKVEIKKANMIGGAIIGGIVGSFLGPGGLFIGASIGGILGHDTSPNR